MTTWNRDDSDLSTLTGISSTTIGTVRITGNTIGLTSDTDLLSLADNTLTINGNISGTLTTSSQNNITSLGTLSSLSTSGDITIGSDADGTDRKIILGHSTSKVIMGIDDSQDCFAINIGSDFETSNTIELTASALTLATSFVAMGSITAIGNLASIDLTTTGDIYLADNKKIYIGSSSDNDYIKATGNSINFYTNDSNRFNILDGQIQHFVPSVYADAGAILKDGSNHTRLSFTDSGSTVLYDESGNTTLTLDTDQNITLAGDLTISGGNITNAITFDNGITNAGTISAGTWNGTALTAAKVPNHDDLNGFVSNEHIDWTTDQGGTDIHTGNVPWSSGSAFDNDNAGIVPNPGSTGTTTKFLREDGSFQVPAYIANTRITFDGSTANGVATFKNADEATVESNLTFDGTDLSIASTGKLILGAGDTSIAESSADTLSFIVGGDTFLTMTETDVINSISITNADNVILPFDTKLFFDGGFDTYITNNAADQLSFVAGNTALLTLKEDGATNGDHATFGTTGVGFTQFTPTYDATDTYVYFNRSGNKGHLTFGAASTAITDIHMHFPPVSGNFTLVIKQHSSGGGSVTNWKTFDEAGGNESTIVWAGGSAPTLTTGANKIDIISVYWDDTNHKAYGVASLNF